MARALSVLSTAAGKGDLWLHGRAGEVRALVEQILREWNARAIDTAYACEAIGGYVGSLHVVLHRRYGELGASCCGPHLEPFPKPRTKSATTETRLAKPMTESGVRPAFGVEARRKSVG